MSGKCTGYPRSASQGGRISGTRPAPHHLPAPCVKGSRPATDRPFRQVPKPLDTSGSEGSQRPFPRTGPLAGSIPLDTRGRQRLSGPPQKRGSAVPPHLEPGLPDPPFPARDLLPPLVPCPLEQFLVLMFPDLLATLLDNASHVIPPFTGSLATCPWAGSPRPHFRTRPTPRPTLGGSGTCRAGIAGSDSSAPGAWPPWR